MEVHRDYNRAWRVLSPASTSGMGGGVGGRGMASVYLSPSSTSSGRKAGLGRSAEQCRRCLTIDMETDGEGIPQQASAEVPARAAVAYQILIK